MRDSSVIFFISLFSTCGLSNCSGRGTHSRPCEFREDLKNSAPHSAAQFEGKGRKQRTDSFQKCFLRYFQLSLQYTIKNGIYSRHFCQETQTSSQPKQNSNLGHNKGTKFFLQHKKWNISPKQIDIFIIHT